jgi:prepilin-type N-terminal cleavage/methylation domain-containing protein
MRSAARSPRPEAGLTLVELMVTVAILGAVAMILSSVLLSTGRLNTRTTRRAEVQMSSRQGLSLMATELRQAGADPGDPPIGLAGIVTARGDLIRVRADLNGDGAIQTAEPSEDVTYAYDSTARAIERDPGTGAAVVIPNVTAMTLDYFDGANQPIGPTPLSAADAARVRAVGITLTTEDRDSRSLTLTTRVALRNQ